MSFRSQSTGSSQFAEKITEDPVTYKTAQSTVTCVYQAHISGFWRNVTILWSKNLMNHSLMVMVTSLDGEINYSCKVDLKPWHFWNKKGYKSFEVEGNPIEVYWDFRSAKFTSSPEPSSDFYMALVSEEEIVLLVGDYKKKAFKRTKSRPSLVEAALFYKKENVFGKKCFLTKARFYDMKKEHEIIVESSTSGPKEPEMWISIDGIVLVQIKNLQWKFRGNETFLVDKQPIQVFWDVYDWLFSSPGTGYGLFIFKPETFEEKDMEGSGHGSDKSTWNRNCPSMSIILVRSTHDNSNPMRYHLDGNDCQVVCSQVMNWIEIPGKVSEEVSQVLAPLADKMNSRLICKLEDILTYMKKVHLCEMLCLQIQSQKVCGDLSGAKTKRHAEIRSLLCKLAYEKNKFELLHLKKDIMMFQAVRTGVQTSEMIRLNCDKLLHQHGFCSTGLLNSEQDHEKTSLLLHNLLDVAEEFQLARMNIPNLLQGNFDSPSAEQLHLQITFLDCKNLRKVNVILDMACLIHGKYPEDIVPCEIREVSGVVLNQLKKEIESEMDNVGLGYPRILRLCRCISKVLE